MLTSTHNALVIILQFHPQRLTAAAAEQDGNM